MPTFPPRSQEGSSCFVFGRYSDVVSVEGTQRHREAVQRETSEKNENHKPDVTAAVCSTQEVRGVSLPSVDTPTISESDISQSNNFRFQYFGFQHFRNRQLLLTSSPHVVRTREGILFLSKLRSRHTAGKVFHFSFFNSIFSCLQQAALLSLKRKKIHVN